jgi:hypothetical protein
MTDQQNTTPPPDHKAVNQWMLAGNWTWLDPEDEGYGVWVKNGFTPVTQDLAAEMYRMADKRVEEARIDTLERIDSDGHGAYYMTDNGEEIEIAEAIERIKREA